MLFALVAQPSARSAAGVPAGLQHRRGLARGHRPLADGRRRGASPPRQSRGPLVLELAGALLRRAQEHRA